MKLFISNNFLRGAFYSLVGILLFLYGIKVSKWVTNRNEKLEIKKRQIDHLQKVSDIYLEKGNTFQALSSISREDGAPRDQRLIDSAIRYMALSQKYADSAQTILNK